LPTGWDVVLDHSWYGTIARQTRHDDDHQPRQLTDRKVTPWRDYLDPVAVFDALGWPSR
jgi:hypothetical protein